MYRVEHDGTQWVAILDAPGAFKMTAVGPTPEDALATLRHETGEDGARPLSRQAQLEAWRIELMARWDKNKAGLDALFKLVDAYARARYCGALGEQGLASAALTTALTDLMEARSDAEKKNAVQEFQKEV